MSNTLCVNFYAGPGAGKSTIAAELFVALKKQHINCELITEYAKKKIWEGNTTCLTNQLYITAKQQYAMWTVEKHVDVIVTDSPLLFGCIYGNDLLLDAIIKREYTRFNNLDVFLMRSNAPYQTEGRSQTFEQAVEKDNEILKLLNEMNINYVNIKPTPKYINSLVKTIKTKISNQLKMYKLPILDFYYL